jgi:hypothetical protein
MEVLYEQVIDLLLAELCLPRDWHRALSELPFQKQSVLPAWHPLRGHLNLCFERVHHDHWHSKMV